MKICFIFPYRGIGGVSVIFCQIAEDIAKNYGYEVYLVDYIDGAISKQINKDVCNFIEYSDSFLTYLPENLHIVFQGMTPWSIFPNLVIPKNSKIFFWTLHYSNFLPVLPGLRRYMKSNEFIFNLIAKTIMLPWFLKTRKFVKFLMVNNGVSYMDDDTYLYTKRLLSLNCSNPSFLPLPHIIKYQSLKNDFKRINDNKIRLLFLGRLVNFKFFSLQLAIKKLSNYSKLKNLEAKVTIVGSGPYLNKVYELSKKYKNLEFEFIENIPYKKIDKYIKGRFDIAFAMGSSALICGASGIATILLDISYEKVNDNYLFSWLHERDGKTLGDHMTSKHFSNSLDTFDKCIDDYLKNPNKISKLTYDYVLKYHSFKKIKDNLLNQIKNTKVNYELFLKHNFYKKGIVYFLFKKLFGSKHNEP